MSIFCLLLILFMQGRFGAAGSYNHVLLADRFIDLQHGIVLEQASSTALSVSKSVFIDHAFIDFETSELICVIKSAF